MTASAALTWALDSDTLLRPLEPADAPAVHRLIQGNRAHLDRWLRWSNAIRTSGDVEQFIAEFGRKQATSDGFHNGIWVNGALAGGLVCWYIHPLNRASEIGYWLGEGFTGRGLATRAAARAIRYLFDEADLNRIEMQCGVENRRSRAVPERLGFTLEGTRRASHRIGDRFLDHCVYGLLAQEWRAHEAARPRGTPEEERSV